MLAVSYAPTQYHPNKRFHIFLPNCLNWAALYMFLSLSQEWEFSTSSAIGYNFGCFVCPLLIIIEMNGFILFMPIWLNWAAPYLLLTLSQECEFSMSSAIVYKLSCFALSYSLSSRWEVSDFSWHLSKLCCSVDVSLIITGTSIFYNKGHLQLHLQHCRSSRHATPRTPHGV